MADLKVSIEGKNLKAKTFVNIRDVCDNVSPLIKTKAMAAKLGCKASYNPQSGRGEFYGSFTLDEIKKAMAV